MTHRVDILVVIEPAMGPPEAGSGAVRDRRPAESDPHADSRATEGGLDLRLPSEAIRLAAMIPPAQPAPDARVAVVGHVTWSADGSPVDLPALADALAAHSRERGALTVLCPDTDLGRELASLLAACLDTCALLGATDAVPHRSATDGDPLFTWVKPVFGGHLEQESTFAPGRIQVVSISPDVLQATLGGSAKLDLVTISPGQTARRGDGCRVRHLGFVPPDYRTVDLVHARRIVAAGAGAVDGPGDGALALVVELAELLEGSVGASRPVTDDRRLPKERLVGQTGKTVAPDLYLALGISGSPHHMAGVQGAERILTVNRDPVAPILALSDTAFVGDLREVLPELVALIKEWRDSVAAVDSADLGIARRVGAVDGGASA